MDFVDFESYASDVLPSPQPSLALPPSRPFRSEPQSSAQKYAALSLQLIEVAPEPETAPAPHARADALSVRLSRALNPPMSDSEIHQAFSRLEQRLASLAPMVDPGVGGSMARKNIRGEIEADMLHSQAAVLGDYARPVKSLRQLGARAANLQRTVAEAGATLTPDENARRVAESVAQISSERSHLAVKRALLVGFRKTFTLNPYDEHLLTAGDIGPDFFAALSRAHALSDRCQLLLALDNPELGLKVMTKTSDLVARAEAKVSTFCNRTLTNAFSLHNRDRVHTLHLCFRYLELRPEQLEQVMGVFVSARAAALVDEFRLQAGEAADNSAVPLPSDARPVFYSQHDPVKYTADLLAYVHSAMVNETDTVANLFGDATATSDGCVPDILAALARPLRSKLETIISSETKLPVLFQIYSHLDLYMLMYSRLPHAQAVAAVVGECIRLAQQKLVWCVSTRLLTIRTSNHAHIELSLDLQPPEWIIDLYADILPLVDGAETVFNLPAEESTLFVDLITHEPIRIFESHLTLAAASFSPTESLIFRLNFLDLVLTKIMPHALLTDAALSINHTIADLCLQLKLLQLTTLLTDCNLADYYNLVSMICPVDDGLDALVYESITENQLFTVDAIVATNATVQAQLPTALVEVQLALMKLNSPIIVNDVIKSSSAQFARFYKLFAEIVEQFLHQSLFSWTYRDVEILLGVDDS